MAWATLKRVDKDVERAKGGTTRVSFVNCISCNLMLEQHSPECLPLVSSMGLRWHRVGLWIDKRRRRALAKLVRERKCETKFLIQDYRSSRETEKLERQKKQSNPSTQILAQHVKHLEWSCDTNLNPGTEFTIDPSFVSHVTSGVGLPWATQVMCAPVLLLNVTWDGGSWPNVGIWTTPPWRLWSLTTIEAEQLRMNPAENPRAALAFH